mgnify:CR=1 FL=1
MSETVKRYDIEECSGNPYESYRDMVRAPDGDWVYYVDYADLAQQLAAARAENERMRADLRLIASAYDDSLSAGELSMRSYDMACVARRALAAQEGTDG